MKTIILFYNYILWMKFGFKVTKKNQTNIKKIEKQLQLWPLLSLHLYLYLNGLELKEGDIMLVLDCW